MNLDFSLHDAQLEILNSEKRYKVIVAGRRFGKTHLAVVSLLLEAMKNENEFGQNLLDAEVWYIAPTFQQGKDLIWNKLKIAAKDITKKVHENTGALTLINGRTIRLKGTDREDQLRGGKISYAVFDEYAFMKPRIWDLIIRPALLDVRGDAMWIGTPDGKNHFYDLYCEAQELTDWDTFHYTSRDNPFLPAEELDALTKNMPSSAYRQEIEASFTAQGGGAFKEEWIIFDDEIKGDVYIAVDPAGFAEETGKIDSRLKKLDETAIAVVTVHPEGWYVNEVRSGRWGVRETSLQILRAAQVHQARAVGIERGSLKNAIMPYLDDQMRRLRFYPRITDLTHGGKKKQERIRWALEGRFEHGRIRFPKDAKQMPWMRKLTDQLLDFPNPLSHDDLIDALAYIDQVAVTNYITDFQTETWEPQDTIAGF